MATTQQLETAIKAVRAGAATEAQEELVKVAARQSGERGGRAERALRGES